MKVLNQLQPTVQATVAQQAIIEQTKITKKEEKFEGDTFVKSQNNDKNPQENICKVDTIGDISEQERRNMLTLTFKLGNSMFFQPQETETELNFSHDYLLKSIQVDEDTINAIEAQQHKYIFVTTMSA